MREWERNCHPSESGACKGGGEIYGRSTKWWYSRRPFKGENVVVINGSATDASLLGQDTDDDLSVVNKESILWHSLKESVTLQMYSQPMTPSMWRKVFRGK